MAKRLRAEVKLEAANASIQTVRDELAKECERRTQSAGDRRTRSAAIHHLPVVSLIEILAHLSFKDALRFRSEVLASKTLEGKATARKQVASVGWTIDHEMRPALSDVRAWKEALEPRSKTLQHLELSDVLDLLTPDIATAMQTWIGPKFTSLRVTQQIGRKPGASLAQVIGNRRPTRFSLRDVSLASNAGWEMSDFLEWARTGSSWQGPLLEFGHATGWKKKDVETLTNMFLEWPAENRPTRLELAGCEDEKSLVALCNACPQLEAIHFRGWDWVSDEFLNAAPSATLLEFQCGRIGELSLVAPLTRLRVLSIDGTMSDPTTEDVTRILGPMKDMRRLLIGFGLTTYGMGDRSPAWQVSDEWLDLWPELEEFGYPGRTGFWGIPSDLIGLHPWKMKVVKWFVPIFSRAYNRNVTHD